MSASSDEGRALIEVVFLAVLILIPTVYILVSVLRIQAATFAVAQGARDAGRVMDSRPTIAVGVARAEEIARLALTDQTVPADGLDLRFVPVGRRLCDVAGDHAEPAGRGESTTSASWRWCHCRACRPWSPAAGTPSPASSPCTSATSGRAMRLPRRRSARGRDPSRPAMPATAGRSPRW